MRKFIAVLLFIFSWSLSGYALEQKPEAVNESRDREKTADAALATKKVHPTSQQATRGLYWNNNVGFAYNYLGFKIESTLYYSIPLVEKPGILFKTTKVDLGFQEIWTPNSNRISAYLKIEPLAIFDVVFTAGYDYIYDEIYGGLYKFSDEDVEKNHYYRNKDEREVHAISKTSGGGFRMTVVPTIKVEFKGLALMYSFIVDYHVYNFEGSYYDPMTHMLHKGNDTFLQHDAKVMYLIEPIMLRIGVRLIDQWVESKPDYHSMLMAGVLYWTPIFKLVPEGSHPYFALLGGTHIKDQYMKNKPYFAFMIGFNWKIQ